MLQRQIMYKHLQELQRKQQLQELGNDLNQNYVNPNMQMLQHGGPNEQVLSQNHNFAPQFDMFSYDNMNQYSHLQGPSNLSMSQRHSFLSDLSNQDSNLFGQVPAGAFNSEAISGNYSPQGFQKNVAFTESENGNENGSSLDPLEQEILYNTDDTSWESALSIVGKMSSGGFESKVETPSLQSGSWSALMQSAVAETSSSDAGIQEEWSGLSFQNPEPLTDTEKLQSDWVDRNLQNNSSPSSKPEKLFPNVNSFANLQQSVQYIQQKEEYHPESSHATMQHSPRNTRQLVDNKSQQIFQGSLTSENIWPREQKENSNNDACNPSVFSCANYIQPSNNLSGREFGGSFWVRGSASGQVSSIQKNHDQVNQMNTTPIGVSTGESVTAPSESVFELLNKDDTSNNQTPSSKVSIHRELPNSPDLGFKTGPSDHHQTPQSHSFSPSFSGNSSATSLHITSDHMENVHPATSVSNHIATQLPAYSAVYPQGNSEFPMGLPTPWPENHNPLRHEYKQPEKGNSAQEDLTEINNSTSLSRNTHHLEANAVESDSFIGNPQNQVSNQMEGKYGAPSMRNAERDNGNNQRVKGSQLNAFWSGTASAMSYNQNPIKTDTSSLTYQHVSPQMAPTWFKNYEMVKDRQILPMYDARAPANATQSFGEVTLSNLQEKSLITQVNLSNGNQVEDLSLSLPASKQLNLPFVLPLDGNLAFSVSKKRKLAVFDMIPWHKVNRERSRLQDISTAEYLWAEVTNRKPAEATNEAEILERLLPVNRAKRRLVSTTQLMQQVFGPQPVYNLCSEAAPNYDCVAYFAARLALGDAWSLTSQLPFETDNVSPDDLKASKRTKACEFSKVVEGFIDRVKEMESNLSRLDKSLSFLDIKIETRELEKVSTINRFAKFHIRPHPIKANPSSSSGTTAPLKNLQKYVVPVPMPSIVPEGQDCLSL